MAADLYAKIRANPKYQQFVSTRSKYSIMMAIIGAMAYYGFILLVAYNKEFLAQKLSAGAVTSVGIPIGVGVIVFTIIITWVYIRRANSEFDSLTEQVVKGVVK